MYWCPELINKIYNKKSNLSILSNEYKNSIDKSKELELLKKELKEKDKQIETLLIENKNLKNQLTKIKK